MSSIKRRQAVAAALLAPFALSARGQDAPARVAAASDLQFVLPEVAGAFHRAGNFRVELNFGSSGNYARQIQQGAPFDLFLSADEAFVLRLSDAGLTPDRGTLYALGRIALVVPAGSAISLDTRLDGVRQRWADVRKFAIANPEHAPYGRAAREALQALGWWERAQARLVLGENVSQATQFVSAGAAQAGITALSLAASPSVTATLLHLALPVSLHQPLRQRMVVLKNAPPAAAAFHDFIASADGQAIFARHGFARPEA